MGGVHSLHSLQSPATVSHGANLGGSQRPGGPQTLPTEVRGPEQDGRWEEPARKQSPQRTLLQPPVCCLDEGVSSAPCYCRVRSAWSRSSHRVPRMLASFVCVRPPGKGGQEPRKQPAARGCRSACSGHTSGPPLAAAGTAAAPESLRDYVCDSLPSVSKSRVPPTKEAEHAGL